ncbi:MAG: outer membrane beta-barrel protein [Opitutaceae bacterium]|nr:outer membrane beta-barrel protein [Opitutaceae bacterium]
MHTTEKPQIPTWLRSAFTGILIISSSVFSFAQVDRGGLTIEATARVGYDSNIFGNSSEVDDTFISIMPELRFLKEDSLSTINARVAMDFTRFDEQSATDFENFYSSFEISLPTNRASRLSGTFNIGYDSINDTNLLINQRLDSDTFSSSANFVFRVSPKTGLRAGFEYTDNQNELFSNTKINLLTAGVQYSVSSRTAVFLDGRLSETESDGGVDNRTKGFVVGLTGQLSPTLGGFVSIGSQSTDERGNIPGDSDSDQLIAFANLTWTPQERTNVVLTFGRDMDVSPGDESVETTTARAQLNHDLSSALSIFGAIELRDLEFRNIANRKDDVTEFNGGITYSINPRFSTGAEVSFFNSNSTDILSDYNREIYSIFASFAF